MEEELTGAQRLAAQISAVKFDIPLHARFKNDEFNFSNDRISSEFLQFLNKLPSKEEGKIRVAIVIGESHVISLAKEFDHAFDLIVSVDLNPRVHEHREKVLECLKKAESLSEFKKSYQEASDFRQNESVAGPYHFLRSERYDACRAFAQKLVFANYHADFLNSEHIQTLIGLLSAANAEVSLVNVTNILDYCERDKTEANLDCSLKMFFQKWPNAVLFHSYIIAPGTCWEMLEAPVFDVSQMKEQGIQHKSAIFAALSRLAFSSERFVQYFHCAVLPDNELLQLTEDMSATFSKLSGS